MCRVDGGEAADFYKSETRKARKTHKCEECSRDIQPGEEYYYSFYIYDGCASTLHMCAHCRIGAEWLRINCGGWMVSEIADELEEHAEDYPHLAPGLLRLVVGMKRKWRKFKSDELMPTMQIPENIELHDRIHH